MHAEVLDSLIKTVCWFALSRPIRQPKCSPSPLPSPPGEGIAKALASDLDASTEAATVPWVEAIASANQPRPDGSLNGDISRGMLALTLTLFPGEWEQLRHLPVILDAPFESATVPWVEAIAFANQRCA